MSEGKQQSVFVSTLMPKADVDDLEKIARRADRTRSAELRRAVREYIEREQRAAA